MTTLPEEKKSFFINHYEEGPESWEILVITDDGENFWFHDYKTMRAALKQVEILERRLLPRTIKALNLTQTLEHPTRRMEESEINDR